MFGSRPPVGSKGKASSCADSLSSAHSEESNYQDLLHIDEMFLECRADLRELLSGKPTVKRVTVRRMRVRATCHRNGVWNAARLLPLPDFGGSVPAIVVEDSTLELLDLCRKSGGAWVLRNINLSAQTPHDGAARENQWQFSGHLLGDHFKRVKLQGCVDTQKGSWTAWGTIDGLEMSERLTDALPNDVAQYLSVLATLRARAHFEFRVGHEPGDDQPIRYVVQGHLSEGRVDDPRLPLSFTDLEADVHADNQQLRIEHVTARSGPTSLQLTCHCQRYLGDSPQLTLTASVSQLPLDERLHGVLPVQFLDEWEKFLPAGVVDARIDVRTVGNQFVPDVTVTCRDVSFAYHKFPLRLQQGNGVLQLVGNRVSVRDFTAVAGGQTIHLSADFQNPGPHATGWLDLRSAGPVPVDHELIEAMTPTGQKIVRSLQPTGGVTLARGRIERRTPDELPHSRWEIELVDCSLQYERFPYAIHKISGRLILADNRWEFQDLRGSHASSYILCSGGWVPAASDMPGGELILNFKCWDVPLDDSLRNAVGKLQAGAGRFWDSMRPRGTVDHVAISVRHDSHAQHTTFDVAAEKWPPDQNVDGRSITVHPTWFPLRLDDCTGLVHFSNGEFQFRNVTAVRGNSRVELAGQGRVSPDESWDVSLTRVTADALPVDHELIDALPEPMRPAVRQLKYRGLISINGKSSFRGGAGQPLTADWDLLLDIDDGALDNQLKLEHVYGGVRLIGEKKAQGFHSRGILEIDSLVTRTVQVSQLQGPFWINARQLVVGSRVSVAQGGSPPRQLTAKAMGGDVTLDAHLLFDDELRFALDATMANGDVADFSRSIHSQRHDISGKVFAVLHLAGTAAGLHTLQGNGQVRLREANIYELPVMVQLLKVLRLRQPDATAFTSSDVDFRVQDELLFLDRIDFSGDAISLKGKGRIDLNRQINLDFYALLGRHEFQLPVIRTLLAEASRNILSIQVVGDIDAPQVNEKPLPELDETLQRLFPKPPRAPPHRCSPGAADVSRRQAGLHFELQKNKQNSRDTEHPRTTK